MSSTAQPTVNADILLGAAMVGFGLAMMLAYFVWSVQLRPVYMAALNASDQTGLAMARELTDCKRLRAPQAN